VSKFQLKKIAFALSLSTALSAHAAGLGSMISSSKLGEPLNAEIELLAVTPSELNSIQATLASEQVYQDQMLEKPASYPFIKIEVGNNTKGQPILKLTSSQPITEAFLDMLIQVDWPTGRLVKEYTLLLDPPGFNSNYVSESAGLPVTGQAASPTTTNNAARVPEASPQPTPEPKPESSKPRQTKPAAAPVPKQVAADEATDTEQTLTTERGDTLYAIARQMKPDNVSVEQMLAALYQSNQQAFDGKNMNRLKVGKIIRMPDQATLDSVSRPQAKSLIAEHATNWQAYKNSLAKVVKESEASQTGGNTQQSAGKIGAAGAKPAPQAKPGKDVLKLSAGDEKSTTQADKSAAKTSATAAQEDATAKANAIKEEQSRAAALEKQVADMKKLMEMKNSAMAQAEKNAAQAATEPKAETKPEAKVEQKPAEQAKVPVAPVVEEKPAPAPEPAKPALPVEEATIPVQQPSFMHVLLERLRNISPVLPLALIALPVLLCVWALIRIRRKKQIDNFEDVIVTSPATEMQNNTVFGDTQAAASGDTSFLTDFSQSGVGGMIDSHDVDPIAEAEVYMAYGRDAQAEEILKDAIQKDSERQELKVKLLEIYQATGNKAAFESLAGEVYAKAGPADAAWAKVSAMGQKLDPENSLYQATPAAVTEVGSLADATVLPVAETQNEEDAYHFNFEAPALEFDGASEAVAAASAESVTPAESPARTAAEEISIEAGVDAQSTVSDDDALQLDARNEPAAQATNDTTLAFTEDPASAAETLRFEVEPASAPTLEAASEDVGDVLNTADDSVDAANVDADLALTPKALDLPSLNLDDVAQSADVASSKPLSATTGEQTLSSEDAVFDSLPELSLELGGPNDAIGERAGDDALEIEEISLGSADAALNETPAVEASADNIAFPEISLDMADSSTASVEPITDEPEEVNTKLDLIQAYIDMEDVVGAKELIDEVIAEGGERQRQRASELLAKLA
jgi:pilus assembly protein FimV